MLVSSNGVSFVLLICFSLYLFLLVILSKVLSKRMASLSDFFLAGRQLPWISITIAMVASYFGAGSTIGTMNETFSKGVSALWLIAIPAVISCLLVGFVWGPKVRQLDTLSQPEAIEKHYGSKTGLLLSWVILATIMTFIASQLVAAGHLVQISMGLPPVLSIALILSAVIFYSAIGGFRTVVLTDIFQFIGYTIALLILFSFILHFPGESQVTVRTVKAFWNPWLNLPHQLSLLLTFVLAWSIAPEMWQRMASTKSPSDAKKSALLASGILACLYALVISIGLLSAVKLHPSASLSKDTLVSLALMLPSPVLTTVVLMGVLAAISSTIDSSINVGSLTFTQNIYSRYLRRHASSKELVFISRISTILIAIPSALLALKYQDIIQTLWISADIYASTMFVPIAGVFFYPQAKSHSGVLAILFGAIPVGLNFLRDFHWLVLPAWFPVWPFTTLMGIALSLIGFLLGIAFSRISDKPLETPAEIEVSLR